MSIEEIGKYLKANTDACIFMISKDETISLGIYGENNDIKWLVKHSLTHKEFFETFSDLIEETAIDDIPDEFDDQIDNLFNPN